MTTTTTSVLLPVAIRVGTPSEIMLYAASELSKYLRLITMHPLRIILEPPGASSAVGITLRLFDDAERSKLGETWDPRYDDAVHVDISNLSGTIAGANPRSVLLAVYRCLQHLGCRWVRPGADGEYLPRVDLSSATIQLDERPTYRHRTICIEGAASLEDVLSLVEWAPKAGFSAYFMQFSDGFTFFDRWYSRRGTHAEAEPFPAQAARAWTIRIEQELARRGLVYHAVGHGWTTSALGLTISHWDPIHLPNMAEARSHMAEIQGRRDLQWDRPMLTSLCFSQPETRKRMVDVVVAHALSHPEVDLLHVWIDDGGNNKCECTGCRQQLPSDLYVRMLQEIDQELTRQACPMRIVFLAYSDLLWPPQAQGVQLNPERFVFMYANSRASYGQALAPVPRDSVTMPAFQLNQNRGKRDMPEFQAFLQGWQQLFRGDSFLFEYHPLGMLFANQYALSQVLHEDVSQLRMLGLNGWISCQSQRVFFPTGMAMSILGASLWNADIDTLAVIDDFCSASFGQDGALAKEFLKVSAEELDRSIDFTGGSKVPADAATHVARLGLLISEFTKVVTRNLSDVDPCRARSWHYMRWYLRILERLVDCVGILVKARPGNARVAWEETKRYIIEHLKHYRSVFDEWAFIAAMDQFFINGRSQAAPEVVVSESS